MAGGDENIGITSNCKPFVTYTFIVLLCHIYNDIFSTLGKISFKGMNHLFRKAIFVKLFSEPCRFIRYFKGEPNFLRQKRRISFRVPTEDESCPKARMEVSHRHATKNLHHCGISRVYAKRPNLPII